LPPEQLVAIGQEVLGQLESKVARIYIDHTAIGMARVALGKVRMQDNGDQILLSVESNFRTYPALVSVNQTDAASLRHVARYLNRLARNLPGDVEPPPMPILPRHSPSSTAWKTSTAAAFPEQRHAAVSALVAPVLDAGFTASAFVGVYAHSTAYLNKHGVCSAGHDTDTEAVVTGWTADGIGSGWAGQAARDWTVLRPDAIATRCIDLTRRSAKPVAFEPGRHMAILDRPAVAQIVHMMGGCFDADATLRQLTPLYNPATGKPRFGERIMDARLMITSDPNDPDGGFLPFSWDDPPYVPMTWVDHGVHVNLGFASYFAAAQGYALPNSAQVAIRLQAVPGTVTPTVDDMIASCKEGIYVNRFSHVQGADSDPTIRMATGVTSGGCFLIRNGVIDKPIRNLRFLDSPWLFLNCLEAIGTSERAPFGFAPWASETWPVEPIIVPPLMVRDFNFNALADAA